MRKKTSVDDFIKGPLSEQAGGIESHRKTAKILEEDLDSDEEEYDLKKRKSKLDFFLKKKELLFSYQNEIVLKLFKWMDRAPAQSELRAAMVSLPTGGGKTRVGVCFLLELLKKEKIKGVVWVAPSIELVEQAIQTLENLWVYFNDIPDLHVYVNQFPRNMINGEFFCIFITAQFAALHLNDLLKTKAGLLIFDEAHQAAAKTFESVVNTQKKFGNVIGLSATPGRSSEKEIDTLSEVFGGNLITSSELGEKPVLSLQKRGVLAKLEFMTIPMTDTSSYWRVSGLKGKVIPNEELSLNKDRFWATVETINKLGANSKTLVFAESISHCNAISAALDLKKIKSSVLSHLTSFKKRKQILSRFEDGEINVVLNKSLLATGYDCPGITDVDLATPIRSPILWEQILGRVSRGPLVGGNSCGKVWELDDHRKMHGEVMSYYRFSGLWS